MVNKPHTEAAHQGNDSSAAHHILQSNKNVISWTFLHVLEETMTGAQSSKPFWVQTRHGAEPKTNVNLKRAPLNEYVYIYSVNLHFLSKQ